MKKKIGLGSLILASAFMSQSIEAASPRKVQVHGHRGARALRPENTLPAFDYALSIGVDVLELDTVVTKDNILVVTHDPVVNPIICQHRNGRALTERLLIRNLTLAQIKELDCGSKQNPRFSRQVTVPGTPMPTLDEVFDFVKKSKHPAAKTVVFNIETKSPPLRPDGSENPEHVGEAPSAKDFASLMLKTVKAHGMFKRLILQSFDHRTLVEARKMDPSTVISALTASDETSVNYSQIIKDLKPNFLSPYYKEINVDDVKNAHKKGVKVAPWTVNDETAWKQMLEMGVDALITDDPEALIQYLDKKGNQK